ncbi:PAS domain S-box protein [Pseudomonas sp. HAR-UPW-AIA-41]|uniref:PAS domain S-box protein n=1 Tax=Pseudomonas sp. HAR-UPW-AIA-41 TaxID=1985301 RepID=UPI001596DD11|nr:PAS domain S-box protein [Pseudomonas sp. HAR-UPW-AIA-41]
MSATPRQFTYPLLIWGSLLLALMFGLMAVFALQRHEQALQQRLNEQQSRDQSLVEASMLSRRDQVERLGQQLAETPSLQQLLSQQPVNESATQVALRKHLHNYLAPSVRLLEGLGIDQLLVHLPGTGPALLREESIQSHGDLGDSRNALLMDVFNRHQTRSGLHQSEQGLLLYTLVPIPNSDRTKPPLAVLELTGSPLPPMTELEQALGAPVMLLQRQQHPELQESHPWQALGASNNHWQERLQQVQLPPQIDQAQRLRLDLPREQSNLVLLPIQPNGSSNLSVLAIAHPLEDLLDQHQQQRQERLAYWILAWLGVQLLLLALLRILQQRLDRQQRALREEHRQSQESRRLLELVQQAQSAFITTQNHHALFEQLLQQILDYTGSRFGFFGEVLSDDHGAPYLRTFAISNIAWDDESRDFYANQAPKGMEFRNLDTLFGQVLRSGEALLSNNPSQHPASGGTPPGHPPLLAFLGLPVLVDQKMTGMLGLANRSGGYQGEHIEQLQPLLACLGQLLDALHREQQLAREQELQLKQQHTLALLNEIAARSTLASDIQLRRGLQLGSEFFGLENGLIARIEDNRYQVEQHFSNQQPSIDGQSFPLHLTYCQITRQQGDDVLAIEHMGASAHADHPGYVEFGLETYIGIVVWVRGLRWGTLSFSAREARTQAFDSADLEFMRLLARWVSAILEREQQEQQRDELLQRLQRLTEQVPGILLQLQLHTDGRRTLPYASDALLNLTGIDPDELRQDASPLFQRIASQDQAVFESSLAQAAQQLKPWIGEFRIQHPQRGELWLGGQASPQRLPDGSLLWHVLLLDISARKQAQSDLTRERQRLRSILEGANCGTWEWNVQTGDCHFDARWLGLIGYAANELQPNSIQHWLQLTHPDDLPSANQALQAHFEGESSHYLCEFRMRHKDGHWVWIEARGRLLSRTAAGDPLMMYGTHLDISARVSADQHNRQTQLFLQTVLDSSTEVSVIATDTDGLITLFNSGAEHLLGYRAHEVVGRQSPALFHLDSEVRARGAELSSTLGQPVEGFAVFIEVARREGAETRQWTYLHKDGRRRQVLLTVSLLYDAEAKLNGYLGIATDISELVSLSQALQASEQRFRGMLSNLPGAAYRCRNDAAWTMFHISDEIERITGYPASDFIDNRVRSYASVVVPEDLAITYSTQLHLANKAIFELSYRLRHRDGHIVWVSEKGRGEYDEHGHLQWIDGFIWDISEQRRAEQMVIEREAYLRTLLDNVIDAIIAIDEYGRIESFNQAAERIFGYSASEVVGRNVSLLMPEPDGSAHDGYISNYRDTGHARILGVSGREMLGLRRDGTKFHLELAVSSIQYQGARRFIGVVRDITEQRRIEQMKNEFVSTVSHELRTPLTSISGALGLVVGGALGEVPAAMSGMLQIAHQNSRRLGLLINDLLDMEKLVAGKMTFYFAQLDLLAQLEEALLHNQPYADEFGVGWRISQTLPGIQVRADSQRLQQVLANLLSNAAKFSPAGSQIELRMSRARQTVRVSVIDQGPGIPAEFQARIFSKFSQADASDTRQQGGTGLGLAITKELMERMDGQVGFVSPPGQGACFWIELPVSGDI